jgi:hypothetical protein
MDDASWLSGARCDLHELPNCSVCKPSRYPKVVVVTRGTSDTYHRTHRCCWLRKGQSSVERRGGEAAPLASISRQQAEGEAREP